jgi:hypothetical protein
MSTALTIDSSLLRNRKAQVFSGILLAKNQDTDDFTTAIPISAGSGAPSHNAAVANEIYIRTDASDSDLLIYRAVNTSGTWETVVGSELTDLLAATNTWTAANTFSHATGVTTDTLTERTAAAGVTVDGCLIKDGRAALLATASLFTSTEQTGTGSSQNVAHGFGAAPSMVWFAVSEDPAGSGFDVAPGAHDATNCVFTVTTGVKFFVYAIK